MLTYLFKTVMFTIIFVTFYSCSKNPTNINKSDKIVEPQIVYVKEVYSPIHKEVLTLVDANGNNMNDLYSVSEGHIWDPIFSNDGDSVLFVMHLDTVDLGTAIYRIDIDGENLIRLSPGYSYENYNPCKKPQILYDGVRIIYLRRADLNDYEIRMLNIENMDDILLISGDFNNLYPEITNDGEWMVYYEKSNLYKYHIASGDTNRITDGNVFSEQFHLNKETEDIVYRSYNPQNPGEFRIAKINLDGSNAIIYNFDGQDPRISADGTLLFTAMGNGNPSTWISNADGSDVRILYSYHTWDEFIQFYPSGDKVLFIRYLTDRALFSCDLNGQNLKQMTPYEEILNSQPNFKP